MSHFAVIDIETTGISPVHMHRIVEVAVVCVDEKGEVSEEWETLVNPLRDVGASHIHGLNATLLYSAPSFSEIAGDMVPLLRGRVPVAHNLSFDTRFLATEFERAGVVAPLVPPTGLCTMRLASRYLPETGRTLEECCDAIGVRIGSAHAAIADARAAAALLRHYIREDLDFGANWAEEIANAKEATWPTVPKGTGKRLGRRTAHERSATRSHFLGRIASRAARVASHPEANSYLDVLDRVLLDRHVSQHEEDELVAVAGLMGLARDQVLELHRNYLYELGRIALADGKVTAAERTDLCSVAKLLGLAAKDVETALEQGRDDAKAAGRESAPVVGAFSLKTGDAVVFTGEAVGIERSSLETQARELGLRVTSSVSGKTSLVVAADPDSSSGKARKARELGLPIVNYQTYFRLIKSMKN